MKYILSSSLKYFYIFAVTCFLATQLTTSPDLYASDHPPPRPGMSSEEHQRRQPPHVEGRGFVSRLDRDGDSRVSRKEFDGPPDRFDHHDKNHDGYLTEDERPLHPPRGHNPPKSRIERESPPPPPKEENVASQQLVNNVGQTETDGKKNLGVEKQSYKETERERWLLLAITLAVTALVIALGWGAYTVKRFKQAKEAVRSLNPHLLGVNIDDNIMITEVSEALCKATGFRCKDLVGKPLMALGSHTADDPNAMQEMWNKIKRGIAWKGEVKLTRRDGSEIWADAVISPSRRKKENPSGYTVIYQDASKRKHYEKLSTRDELTGLFNRRYFNEISKDLLMKTSRSSSSFALCLLDVDNFKKYNDQYGHPAGDRVLAAIGSTLTRLFQRRDDLAFRLGGEEFGGIIIVNDREEAISFAQKLLLEIRNLQIPHEKNPPGIVTVSIGLNMVSGSDSGDIDTIYKRADQALYLAKEKGRNRIVA